MTPIKAVQTLAFGIHAFYLFITPRYYLNDNLKDSCLW